MKNLILLSFLFVFFAKGYSQSSVQLADSAYNKMKNGKFDDAVVMLEKAIAADAGNAKAFYYMGLAKANTKNYNQAIIYFSKAIQLDTTLHDALYNRAVTNYYLGRNQNALDDYARLIKADAFYYLAYIGSGNIYAADKEFKIAKYYYSVAMKIEPDRPDPYRFRGSVYYNSGNTEDACFDWDQAISLGDSAAARYRSKYCIPYFAKLILESSNKILNDANDTLAYADRYFAYSYMKDYDHALADINKVIELDPTDTVAYYNRGVVYGYLNNFDKAIADYTKAIALHPEYLEAYYNRSDAYKAIKSYDNAIADLTSLIEISKGHYNLYLKRGSLYLLNGDKIKACIDFNTAFAKGDAKAKDMINMNCK